MADPASPASARESTPARTPAPKDKHCPYCDQPFTSSSLGRHLDLYIKEKNPKPPDGVHDIDEIRKLRGGITRRSARTSSVKRECSTPATSKHSPDDGAHPSPTEPAPPLPAPAPAKSQARVGEPGWQVAGVMGGLPLASNDGIPRLDGRRDSVRRYGLKTGAEHKERLREALDNGRAAELALREVLDSLRTAR